MSTHTPDVASSAFVIAETWCTSCFFASNISIYITSLEACTVAIELNEPRSLDAIASKKIDSVLLDIRPRCTSLTIRLHPTSGQPRTLTLPPRATHCLKTHLQPLARMEVVVHGWRQNMGVTGYVSATMSTCASVSCQNTQQIRICAAAGSKTSTLHCRLPKRTNITQLASALGRLALCHPHVTITCHDQTSGKSKKLATRSCIPESEKYTRVAVSANSLSLKGLLAAVEDPNSKAQAALLSVTVQEASINGTPVVDTAVHEYVDSVHKRVLAAQKRKAHTPQPPSYLLHLTINPDEVTFTGPALRRSALIPLSHGVQMLLASIMMQAWGKTMPAAVVGELQATIEAPLPHVHSTAKQAQPSHADGAGQAVIGPAQGKDKASCGPYGRILTPTAKLNRSAAFSPIGTVLRARRLVLQASDVAMPSAHATKSDVRRKRKGAASLSAPHMRPLHSPSAKKHKSAICGASPHGMVRENAGRHRNLLLQTAEERLPQEHNSDAFQFCSVHPHSRLTKPCEYQVEGCAGQGGHTDPHQLPPNHCPLGVAADDVRCHLAHWSNEKHCKKRSRQPVQRCSAPANTKSNPDRLPASPVRQGHTFRTKSIPLCIFMDCASEELDLTTSPGDGSKPTIPEVSYLGRKKWPASGTRARERAAGSCAFSTPTSLANLHSHSQQRHHTARPYSSSDSFPHSPLPSAAMLSSRSTPTLRSQFAWNHTSLVLSQQQGSHHGVFDSTTCSLLNPCTQPQLPCQQGSDVHLHGILSRSPTHAHKRPTSPDGYRISPSSQPCHYRVIQSHPQRDIRVTQSCPMSDYKDLLQSTSPARSLWSPLQHAAEPRSKSLGFLASPQHCSLTMNAHAVREVRQPSSISKLMNSQDGLRNGYQGQDALSFSADAPGSPVGAQSECMELLDSPVQHRILTYPSGDTGRVQSVHQEQLSAEEEVRTTSLTFPYQWNQSIGCRLQLQAGITRSTPHELNRSPKEHCIRRGDHTVGTAILQHTAVVAKGTNPLQSISSGCLQMDCSSSLVSKCLPDQTAQERFDSSPLASPSTTNNDFTASEGWLRVSNFSSALSDSPGSRRQRVTASGAHCTDGLEPPLHRLPCSSGLKIPREDQERTMHHIHSSLGSFAFCDEAAALDNPTSPQMARPFPHHCIPIRSGRMHKNTAAPRSDSRTLAASQRPDAISEDMKILSKRLTPGALVVLSSLPGHEAANNMKHLNATQLDMMDCKANNAVLMRSPQAKRPCCVTVHASESIEHLQHPHAEQLSPEHPTSSLAEYCDKNSQCVCSQDEGKGAPCASGSMQQQSITVGVQQHQAGAASEPLQGGVVESQKFTPDQASAGQNASSTPEPEGSSVRPAHKKVDRPCLQVEASLSAALSEEWKQSKAVAVPVIEPSNLPSTPQPPVQENTPAYAATIEEPDRATAQNPADQDSGTPNMLDTQRNVRLITDFKRAAKQQHRGGPVAHAGGLEQTARLRTLCTQANTSTASCSVSRQCLLDGFVVGQAFKKILLVSSGTHLLALDQHAADERVRLEALQLQLCDALNLVSTPSQSILLPAAPARQQKISSRQGKVLSSHSFRSPVGVHLSSAQAVTLWDPKVAGVLQCWGFKFVANGDTGGGSASHSDSTVDVIAVPVICGRQLQPQDLVHFINMERNGADRVSTEADLPQVVQNILQSVACRSAIMFGDTLLNEQRSTLLAALQQTKAPFQCAHGRPTTAPLADVSSLQQGSDVRQQAARMKAGSMNDYESPMHSLKQKLTQQLQKYKPLELTLCIARGI